MHLVESFISFIRFINIITQSIDSINIINTAHSRGTVDGRPRGVSQPNSRCFDADHHRRAGERRQRRPGC